jgi:hypothetical protein
LSPRSNRKGLGELLLYKVTIRSKLAEKLPVSQFM